MHNNHLLSRADAHILRDAYRNSESKPVHKSGFQRHISEYVDATIRKLAETLSQQKIADILNSQDIRRPNGQRWKQYHICRFMQVNNIKAVHKWRGSINAAYL